MKEDIRNKAISIGLKYKTHDLRRVLTLKGVLSVFCQSVTVSKNVVEKRRFQFGLSSIVLFLRANEVSANTT